MGDSSQAITVRNTGTLRPPWPKGVSGNPSGRPKGILRDKLFDALIAKDDKRLNQIVAGIVKSAAKGNPKAFAVIRDSIDGRPLQQVEHVADQGQIDDAIGRIRAILAGGDRREITVIDAVATHGVAEGTGTPSENDGTPQD